eukprot:GFUD01042657.1.p1 GENE.GFUD01042657.1~~GFUD01042657.1.p1  ORF type:complete len:174 (+),score=42.98 GFUD01042657.1:52-522(+)
MGLLGFCVDFPLIGGQQDDIENNAALYEMFEKTLKENCENLKVKAVMEKTAAEIVSTSSEKGKTVKGQSNMDICDETSGEKDSKREAFSKESKFECNLCKKKFDRYEDRHKHFLSDHTGVKEVVIQTVKRFECSICKTSFDEWQERHEHYGEVHAI